MMRHMVDAARHVSGGSTMCPPAQPTTPTVPLPACWPASQTVAVQSAPQLLYHQRDIPLASQYLVWQLHGDCRMLRHDITTRKSSFFAI